MTTNPTVKGIHPDEKKEQAVEFLRNAVAYYDRLGVTVRACSRTTALHSFTTVPGSVHRTLHQTQLHAALSAADQRQGGAVHPVSTARMGLRLDLPELGPENACLGELAAPLQLASPPQLHRRQRTHVQTQRLKKQPLDASDLVLLSRGLGRAGRA